MQVFRDYPPLGEQRKGKKWILEERVKLQAQSTGT